jgi:7-carboxy-7-deazaguanine synthase
LSYPTIERFLESLRPEQQQWKFVIRDNEDELLLHSLLLRYPSFAEQQLPIVLQPEGDTATSDYAASLAWLAELVRNPFWNRYSVRILPQMHVIIWGRSRWV